MILIVALVALLGSQVVTRWLPGSTSTEQLAGLAWGWLLAQATIGLSALVLWFFGRPLAWSLGVLVLVAFAAVLVPAPLNAQQPEGLKVSDLLLNAVVIGLLTLTLLSAWSTSGLGWDGQGIWGLKGKLLAAGALDWETLRHPLSRPSHPEYPLHLPLSAAAFAEITGGWQTKILPVLAAFDLMAFWLLLSNFCEARAGQSWMARGWKTAALLGVASTPLLWRELPEGKADVSLGVFVAAALIALETWRRSGRSTFLVLAALAGGLAAATKQEGMVYLILLLAIALLLVWRTRRFDRGAVAALVVAGALALPWPLARLAAGIETESFRLSADVWARLPIIVGRVVGEMLRLEHWGILWPLVLLAMLAAFRAVMPGRQAKSVDVDSDVSVDGDGSPDREAGFPAASLMLAGWLFIIAAYATTPHDLTWHLDTSLERLLLQLVPTAGLLVYGAGTSFTVGRTTSS